MICRLLKPRLRDVSSRIPIFAFAGALVLLAVLIGGSICLADDHDEVKLRELFVPRTELPLLLEHQPRRVFMTREQFDRLRHDAKVPESIPSPRNVLVSHGTFQITINDGRAAIQGKLLVEVLEDGIHTVPLVFGGLGIQQATLDGHSAAMALGDVGEVLLLVSGKGVHPFELTMTAPVSTAAAIQTLHLQFPETGSSAITLTVPGNVEVLSGAVAIRRVFAVETNATQFDLLPQRGPMALVLSLNNRSLQDRKIVTANSVVTSELSTSWETLNAEVAFRVLHGTTDRFQIRLPKEFDVSNVRCVSLARWTFEDELDARVLTIELRRTIDRKEIQHEVVHLSASRQRKEGEAWNFPKIELLDVESTTSIAGVILGERLKLESIQESGVIPIDSAVVANRIEKWESAQGSLSPPRIVIAYYAPQGSFDIAGNLVEKPADFRSKTNLVLVAKEQELELHAGIAVLVVEEQLVQLEFLAPPGWPIQSIEDSEGNTIPWREAVVANERRLRVSLPKAVRPGQTVNLIVKAKHVPAGWLGNWTSFSIEFPKLRVLESSLDEGACAIAIEDDLSVRPEELVNLALLNDVEKKNFRLEDIPTQFAYKFETSDWSAKFLVERNQPLITATSLGFFLIEPTGLTSKFELRLNIHQARTQEVRFSLHESTPAEVSIQGLDGILVRDTSSTVSEGRRHWTIALAQKSIGEIKLSIEFVQPLPTNSLDRWSLPDLRVEDVLLQSGYYAVEGHSDLDVTVLEHPRMVDQGELVDSIYSVGRHQVGTYAFAGEPRPVVVRVAERQHAALPLVLVEKASLTTWLGVNGRAQTSVRYRLRTKSPALHFDLPDQAELWSIVLDNQPIVPQNDGGSLLIPFESSSTQADHEIQIVYEVPVAQIKLLTRTSLEAPILSVFDRKSSQRLEVPIADVEWQIGLPSGYHIVTSQGSLHASRADSWAPFWDKVGYWLRTLGGYGKRAYVLGQSKSRSASTGEIDDYGFPGIASPALPYDAPQSEASVALDFAQVDDSNNVSEPIAKQILETPQSQSSIQASQELDIPLPKDGAIKGKGLNEGWKSLNIDFEQPISTTSFQSFGARPHLEFQIAQHRPWSWLVDAIGAMLLARTLYLLNRNAKRKLRWLFLLVIIGCLVPIVMPWTETTQLFAEVVMFAAIASFGLYLLWFLFTLAWQGLRSFGNYLRMRSSRQAAVSMIMGLMIGCSLCSSARTQNSSSEESAKIIDLLKASTPLQIPDDAIIVPYDPDSSEGSSNHQEILIPFETYEKLWKLVEAANQPSEQRAPRDWAWKNVQYESHLQEDDRFTMRGRLELEVYSDAMVSIPFPVIGGVLASVTMDGRPAQLTVVNADPQVRLANNQNSIGKPAQNPPSSLFLLQAEGRGTRLVEVTVQFAVERQGGWRIVTGLVPVGQANRWDILIPVAGTDLKLTGVVDRTEFRSPSDETTFRTAISNVGSFGIQWRPRISEASIDQGLSVESQATIDLREDAIRMYWKTNLTFRRGRREALTFEVPNDYLVEEVLGGNVRGWTVRDADGLRFLDVELLEAAQDSESLEIRLSRRRDFTVETEQIDLPWVRVPDSMLQQGTLTLRRSRWLDLRSEHHEFVSRVDLMATDATPDAKEPFATVDLVPFQSFRFLSVPYRLTVNATPVPFQADVSWKGLLKIAPQELILEAKFQYTASTRPLHRLRLAFPSAFALQPPMVPCGYDWYIEDKEDQQVVHILPERGIVGTFDIVMLGTKKRDRVDGQVATQFPVPSFRALDVGKQEGVLVLQADPSFNVRLEQLDNAELLGLNAADAWLQSEEKSLVRAVLSIRGDRFSALATTIRKTPVVQARSISNVRVTEKAIEETILLDWTIREASIQQFAFVLPWWMREARISAPWLRQLQRHPTAEQPDAPIRFILDLQDEVIGEFRVKIENDRPLDAVTREVPIPIIETGQTLRRFVLLENAGRDELIAGEGRGVEPLHTQSPEWNELARVLGTQSAQAFYVRDQAESPLLRFSFDARTAIDTVGARVGLFITQLALDRAGTFRASAELRVENRNEPYVEMELPQGAAVWTVTVAGEPVKPMLSNQPGRVRIPLIKTPVGSLDYPVIMKYGGEVQLPTSIGKVSLPFLRVVNIRPEQSQVRLFLPDEQHWFDFRGTLGRVRTQSEWDLGLHSFKQRQIDALQRVIESKAQSKFDAFSQTRAKANLRQLKQAETTPYSPSSSDDSERSGILSHDESIGQKVAEDNRTLLGRSYSAQGFMFGSNAVKANGNFFFNESETSSSAGSEAWIKKDSQSVMDRGNGSKELQHHILSEQLSENARAALRPNSTPLRIESMERSQADKKNSASEHGIEEKLKQYETQLQMNIPLPGYGGPGQARGGGRASEIGSGQSRQQPGFDTRDAEESPAANSLGATRGLSREAELRKSERHQLPPLSPSVPGGPPSRSDSFQAGGPLSSLGVGVQHAATIDRPASGGFVSLDLPFPTRGVEFMFSTPGGDLELSARTISKQTTTRWLSILVVGVSAVSIWFGWKLTHTLWSSRRGRFLIVAIAFIGTTICLVAGFPIYAILLAFIGLVGLLPLETPSHSRTIS